MMPRTVGRMAIVAALFGLPAARLRSQTSDVARGIEALARRDIAGAERLFRLASKDDIPTLRAAADQWRARLAWRIRGDTATARALAERALAQASDSTSAFLELARLEGCAHRHSAGVEMAHRALTSSGDAERRGAAAQMLVSLAMDGAFAVPARSIRDSIPLDRVVAARDTLRARVARYPGRTIDALALIRAAILTGSLPDADVGLASYFLLSEPALPPLEAAADWMSLAGTLADRRLFEEAELAVRLRPVNAPVPARLRDVGPYALFLRDMRDEAARHYRRALTGTAQPGELARSLIAHERVLWKTLHRDSAPTAYYPAGARRELARRFGTVMTVETRGAVSELHLAHRLTSRRIGTGEEAGELVVLDGVVAKGLDAWLLDDAGGRGGWTANDTAYQIRTAFTENPFRSWIGLTEPQAIPGELFRITRDSVGDIDRVRRDSLGYFPGVAARLFREGAQAILDSVSAVAGRDGGQRQRAFTTALFHALIESSIALHEGRHLMDERRGRPPSSADAELNAKVDEVSSARHPRLALTAILSPNIGDASPHGQANRRVMAGLNRWIRANGATIAGYDRTSPALLQLPKLTEDQLRAAFRSMRPAR